MTKKLRSVTEQRQALQARRDLSAMASIKADLQLTREKTERLRALRLAHEAQEAQEQAEQAARQAATPPAPRKKRPAPKS